jgi:hypothetical protein
LRTSPGRLPEAAFARQSVKVFHTIHKGVGRNVSGPEEASDREPGAASNDEAPPGHFVSQELESDCLRFLEQVRKIARRRAETLAQA